MTLRSIPKQRNGGRVKPENEIEDLKGMTLQGKLSAQLRWPRLQKKGRGGEVITAESEARTLEFRAGNEAGQLKGRCRAA